jgi:hypothetical protein
MRAPSFSAVALTLAALVGCTADEGGSPAAPQQPAAIQEASLAATWKMSQASPVGTVEVTMEVRADHVLTISVASPAAAPGGGTVMAEAQRETFSWSLAKNVLTSTKTECKYAGSDGALKAGDCTAPTQEVATLSLTGNSLTVIKGDIPYVFTKQ